MQVQKEDKKSQIFSFLNLEPQKVFDTNYNYLVQSDFKNGYCDIKLKKVRFVDGEVVNEMVRKELLSSKFFIIKVCKIEKSGELGNFKSYTLEDFYPSMDYKAYKNYYRGDND